MTARYQVRDIVALVSEASDIPEEAILAGGRALPEVRRAREAVCTLSRRFTASSTRTVARLLRISQAGASRFGRGPHDDRTVDLIAAVSAGITARAPKPNLRPHIHDIAAAIRIALDPTIALPRGAMRRASSAHRQMEAVRLRREGHKVIAIAAILKCTPRTIWLLLAREKQTPLCN